MRRPLILPLKSEGRNTMMARRTLLQACMAGGAAAALAGCAVPRTARAGPTVVVVGSGFGDATVARYIRLMCWATPPSRRR